MSDERDTRLKQTLARLFRSAKGGRPSQPATVELRLANLEKKLDQLETRIWTMVGAVAVAEFIRILIWKGR